MADAVNERGGTALMRSASGGHAAAIEALLKAGARVEAADKRGKTALMYAADGGQIFPANKHDL